VSGVARNSFNRHYLDGTENLLNIALVLAGYGLLSRKTHASFLVAKSIATHGRVAGWYSVAISGYGLPKMPGDCAQGLKNHTSSNTA